MFSFGMASFAKGVRIIKLLTPEQVSQALAAWVLEHSGVSVSHKCKVETQFAMTRQEGAPTVFKYCRVDVEVE